MQGGQFGWSAAIYRHEFTAENQTMTTKGWHCGARKNFRAGGAGDLELPKLGRCQEKRGKLLNNVNVRANV